MKYLKFPIVGIAIAVAIFFSCKRDIVPKPKTSTTQNGTAVSDGSNLKKAALNAPTLTCGTSTGASITIRACAGASGAPAGFSVQWMLKSDYEAYGWPVNSDNPANPASFCKASFSGVPGCSNYNLGANICTDVNIGESLFDNCGASATCITELKCEKEYVFRSFAHNDPASGSGKSDFSATLTCSTSPCGGEGCTYTQGYWKTHGPEGCVAGNNTNAWAATSLQLGTVSYTDLQLCSILNTPASGNGLIALAHQLIAAKLNIANGSDGTTIASSIAAADALIGGLTIPPVGSGSLASSSTSSLISTLTNYNEGATGPGHCN